MIGLHQFLQDGLIGTLPRTTEALERFRSVMGEGVIGISPWGSWTERDPLLEEFETTYGQPSHPEQPICEV